jgi:CheY-like chemotaxis protein
MGDRKYKFFIVDDDHKDLFLISEKLTRIDGAHAVIQCRNSQDLYKMMDREGFLQANQSNQTFQAVLILDINMPETDGIEILNQLKNHPMTDDIPVILCSQNATADHIYEAFRARAQSCLNKDFTAEDLLEVLEKIKEPHSFYLN